MSEQITEENVVQPLEESTGNETLDKRLAVPVFRGDKGVDTAQVWMSGFLIVALGVIAYSNVFSIPFHVEDRALLSGAGSISPTPAISGLTLFSLRINQLVSAHSPWLFHLKNLGIHIANALLLFLLCRRLLPGVTPVIAMLAGMLFVLHPLNTESVDYIVGRASLLPAFFMLCSLLAFTYVVQSEPDKERATIRPWPLILSVFCFALGWSAGVSAIVLPMIVLGVDLYLNRDLPWRTRAVIHAPYWVLLVAFVIARAVAIDGAPISPAGPAALAEFVRLIVVPYPLSVAHASGSGLPLFGVLAALVLVLALPVLRLSLAGIGAFWAVESLLLGGSGGFHERDAYFAVAGAVLIVPWVFQFLRNPSARAVAGLVVAALVISAATGAYLRNTIWQDEVSLWSDAAAKDPQAVVPLRNLGHAYVSLAQRMGQPDLAATAYVEAEKTLRSALERSPDDAQAALDLAQAVMGQGRRDEALDLFRNVARANMADRDAFIYVGELLAARFAEAGRQADLVNAVDYLKHADVLRPLDGPPLAHLASAMSKLGNLDAAEPVVQRMLMDQQAAEGSTQPKANAVHETLDRVGRMEKQAALLLAKDDEDVVGLKFQAQALALRNQYITASYSLDMLNRAKVHDYPVWLLMGFIRARMNAEDHFLQEWGETPIKPGEVKSAWAELARACAGAGMWDAALAYLKSPGANKEIGAPPRMTLAEIAVALQQPERAIEYLKKAAEANPTDYKPWLRLFDLTVANDAAAARKYLGEAGNRGAPASEMDERAKKVGITTVPSASADQTTTKIIQ